MPKQNKSPEKSQAGFAPTPQAPPKYQACPSSALTRPPYINPLLLTHLASCFYSLQWPPASSSSLSNPLSSPLDKNTTERRQKKPFYLYLNKIQKRKRKRQREGEEEQSREDRRQDAREKRAENSGTRSCSGAIDCFLLQSHISAVAFLVSRGQIKHGVRL
jgi:hypothetical protein